MLIGPLEHSCQPAGQLMRVYRYYWPAGGDPIAGHDCCQRSRSCTNTSLGDTKFGPVANTVLSHRFNNDRTSSTQQCAGGQGRAFERDWLVKALNHVFGNLNSKQTLPVVQNRGPWRVLFLNAPGAKER